MNLGLTLAEYERQVGPMNKYFHERATAVRLYREGILPLDDDGQQDVGTLTNDEPDAPKTHGRGI